MHRTRHPLSYIFDKIPTVSLSCIIYALLVRLINCANYFQVVIQKALTDVLVVYLHILSEVFTRLTLAIRVFFIYSFNWRGWFGFSQRHISSRWCLLKPRSNLSFIQWGRRQQYEKAPHSKCKICSTFSNFIQSLLVMVSAPLFTFMAFTDHRKHIFVIFFYEQQSSLLENLSMWRQCKYRWGF